MDAPKMNAEEYRQWQRKMGLDQPLETLVQKGVAAGLLVRGKPTTPKDPS